MDEKLLFCVSVRTGDQMMYEAEWRETERGRTLIDLFVEVCGNNVLGRQVQVLVSKDRSFLEAAVVQVCTPLEHLADKTQSYIQYILKENNVANKKNSPIRSAAKFAAERDTMVNTSRIGSNTSSPSKHNIQTHDIENWKDYYSSKTFHIDHDFSEENGTSDILRKKEAWIHTSTPNQTLKTSFVNMTVEEICNEIKKMKAKEPLKNTLSSWVEDNNKKQELDIKHKDQVNLYNSSVDQSPRKSSTSSKVTPKCSKPTKNISATNLTVNSSLENINKTPTKSVKQPIRKTVSSPRTPSIDRLSVLAQPRRRHSSPVKPNITNKPNTIRKSLTKERINKVKRSPPLISKNTSIKNTAKKTNFNTIKSNTVNKNVNTNTNATHQPSAQQSTEHQTDLNSTFVQREQSSNCGGKTMKSKKLASSEYFVEIFTKDVDKKKTTEGRGINKEKIINKKADEKTESNSINSTPSSKDSAEKQIDSNINSKDVSDKSVVKESTIKNDNVTNVIMESHHNDFDDGSAGTFSMLEFDDILNAVKSQMKTDIRNSENDEEDKNSFDSLIEEDFKTFPMNFSLDFSSEEEDEDILFIKSPQKDHSKVKVQMDDSFKIEQQDDVFMKLPTKSCAIKIEFEEPVRSNNDQLTLDHVNNSIKTKVDCVQNDIWLNSRGIKFLGKHNDTEQNVNDDEAKQMVASGEMNKNKENDNLIAETGDQINEDLKKHSNDAAEQESILDKHRKHWGNKIEGMDSMLVASLQAFSLDLRTSTESLASNIRIVYEDWRSKYENETDVPLESMDNGNFMSSRKSSPKLNEDVSQQQGMAIIFRNLRKAEVHLKTMEQAALTMVKVLHENNDVIKDETEESTKIGLQRTKSFKWNDLKTAAKNQSRPEKWLNHKLTTQCSSDSDD